MVTKSVGNGNGPSESGGATNEPSGSVGLNRRIGPIFKYGLAVGFTLILLGGLSLNLSLTSYLLEILVVCAGLSIIFGAFGSTAKVRIPDQGIVLTGVAAIAVALFSYLMWEMDSRYVHVQIGGDVKGSQIEFIGDQSYLGSFQKSEKAFDFVIFGKEIGKPVLALYITLPNGKERQFECIDIDNLRPYLGSGKTIVWRFSEETGTLMNVSNRQRIAEEGPCREGADPIGYIPSLQNRLGSSFTFPFISIAYAQPEVQTTMELIEQLDSSANYLRREARSLLAKKGISVIQPLLVRLAEEPLSYRSRLGVIVALTEMMRVNKPDRAEIINSITDENLILLVVASADEDRTVRIYASEFLYDLGDPRAIPIAIERIHAATANGRYNLLLVIKGAVPFAPQDQQTKVIEQVTALKSENTPKTNDLIDSIVKLARKSLGG